MFAGDVRARFVRNEDIRVADTQHNIEELSGDSTDLLVVEVVHNRNASFLAGSESSVPSPVFLFVVVVPVGGEDAGIREGVCSNISFAFERGIERDVERSETCITVFHRADFGL